jgi:hypothetical protein
MTRTHRLWEPSVWTQTRGTVLSTQINKLQRNWFSPKDYQRSPTRKCRILGVWRSTLVSLNVTCVSQNTNTLGKPQTISVPSNHSIFPEGVHIQGRVQGPRVPQVLDTNQWAGSNPKSSQPQPCKCWDGEWISHWSPWPMLPASGFQSPD